MERSGRRSSISGSDGRPGFHRALEPPAISSRINRWTPGEPFSESCDPEVRRQALDAFMVRVAVLIIGRPGPEDPQYCAWASPGLGSPLYAVHALVPDPQAHTEFLEPRVDFFKAPSQM